MMWPDVEFPLFVTRTTVVSNSARLRNATLIPARHERIDPVTPRTPGAVCGPSEELRVVQPEP